MKQYKSYMDRQEISPAVHENLLNLEAGKKSARPWMKYGALAACAALIIGVGAWKLAPAPATTPNPPQSSGQFAADYNPLPGEKDMVESDDLFVVSSPAGGGKLAFPMIPDINYQDITDWPQADACRVYMPGSFLGPPGEGGYSEHFRGAGGRAGGGPPQDGAGGPALDAVLGRLYPPGPGPVRRPGPADGAVALGRTGPGQL